MNKYWKALGITAVTAAILYYPALKLYQYITGKKTNGDEKEDGSEEHHVKQFSPAYRGKHLPHHRHPHDGQA